jgi:hypothetical protein
MLRSGTPSYDHVAKSADALRRARLFTVAALRYEVAATVAPDLERQTAMLCRAWECAEQAVGRLPTIEGA